MSLIARKGSIEAQKSVIAMLNQLRQSAAKAGSFFHVDVATTPAAQVNGYAAGTNVTVTTPAATDAPTSVTLANALQAFSAVHAADAVNPVYANAGAHLVADTALAATLAAIPAATNLATTQTLANGLKVFWNAHFTSAGVHSTNDGTNTIATANATDQASSNALLTAIKAAINAHVVSAPAGYSLKLIDP